MAAGGGCGMSMAVWALGPDGDYVYAAARNASAWLPQKLGNICMATHGKDDTHKSRRVVLVFHISHMRISLWISRPCLFKEKRAPACMVAEPTGFLLCLQDSPRP